MKKFKRKLSKNDIDYSIWLNSLQYTGFINEDLLKAKNKDFWQAMVNEIYTDYYTSSIYEYVLLAYQEQEYTEELMQAIITIPKNDDELYIQKPSTDIYTSLSPTPHKIYRCLFVSSPIGSMNATIGAQIKNTLDLFQRDRNGNIIGEYRGWTVIPKVEKFLIEQLKMHQVDNDILNRGKETLKLSKTTIAVPIQEHYGHYTVRNIDRRPLLGETFFHHKTILDQIQFIFKQKKKSSWIKYTAYFSVGIYTRNNFNKEIFYIKFFETQYINPLLVFDEDEVDELVRTILSNDINDDTRRILLNTYECYLDEVEEVKKEYKNRVPSIFKYLEKPNDIGFEKKKLRSEEKLKKMELDTDTDNDEELNESDMSQTSVKDEKTFTVSRNTVTLNTLYGLIMGYNGKTYYSYYAHLGNELLMISDMSKGNFQRSSQGETNNVPRGLQIIKTISSNSNIMTSNEATNPIDVFMHIPHKKKIYNVDTNPNTKRGSSTIPNSERYREIGVDYGVRDSFSVNSAKTAGIQGNVSILQVYRDRFIFEPINFGGEE